MPAIQHKAEIDVRAPAAAAFAIVAGERKGFSAWFEKILGSGLSQGLELSHKKRLAYVQFQAERQ